MADSLTSPGLIKAANSALVKAGADFDMIKLFAHDFSDEAGEWGSIYKVPLVDGSGVSAFNISTNDYENANGTVTYATISCNVQPKSTFEFKGDDLLEAPNAPYWNTVAEAAAQAISRSFSAKFSDVLSGDTAIVSAAQSLATVSKANLAKLRKDCQGRVADTVLALSPAKFSDALALFDTCMWNGQSPMETGIIRGLYGFKAVVCLPDIGSGINGYLIPQDAIGVISRRVAVGDPSCYSEYGTVTDENGITLTVLRHGSAAKGKGFLNVTSLFGVGVIQADKIRYIA